MEGGRRQGKEGCDSNVNGDSQQATQSSTGGHTHTHTRTHAHVRARPHKCICYAVDQLARDAEIADLDLALRVDEDVRGLHVCGAAGAKV